MKLNSLLNWLLWRSPSISWDSDLSISSRRHRDSFPALTWSDLHGGSSSPERLWIMISLLLICWGPQLTRHSRKNCERLKWVKRMTACPVWGTFPGYPHLSLSLSFFKNSVSCRILIVMQIIVVQRISNYVSWTWRCTSLDYCPIDMDQFWIYL